MSTVANPNVQIPSKTFRIFLSCWLDKSVRWVGSMASKRLGYFGKEGDK
jgi:hypothetical protein